MVKKYTILSFCLLISAFVYGFSDTTKLDFSNKVKAGQFRYRENSKFNIKYIDVEDGLSSSFIQGITEDNYGNIWIGTWGGGLMKFDGNNIYKLNNYSGLPNNVLLEVYCDSKGAIWANFEVDGLYKIENNHIIDVGANTPLKEKQIREICEISDNKYWVITNDSSFFEIHNDQITDISKKYGIKFSRIYDINKFGNRIGLATDSGLYFFEHEKLIKTAFENQKITCISFKSTEEYLIKHSDGIFAINKTDSFALILIDYKKVSKIIYDNNGSFWLASYNNGVYKYHFDSKKIDNFNENNGLTYNNIWSLHADSRNNVWIGTRASGICRYDGDLFRHYTPSDGLTGKTVWALSEDVKNKTVYLGMLNGGICKFQNGKIEPIEQINSKIADLSVRSNLFDSKENLWIGTLTGLWLYDKNKNLVDYRTKHPALSHGIFRIKERADGTIMVGTDRGIVYITKSGAVSPYKNDSINKLQYCDFITDKQDRTWIGHEYGLVVIDRNEKEICKVITDSIKTIAFTLLEDTKGNIWVGTRAGIFIYTIDKKLIKINEKNGLTSDIVWSLGEDKSGAVWAGTEFGLSKLILDKSGKITIKGFGIQEGFTGNDCTQNGLLIDQNGNFWWGTSKKLTVINPALSYSSSKKPAILFNDVTIHYNSLNIFDGFNRLTNAEILNNLTYQDNYITIHFSAIDWGNESKVKYQYFLKNFSDDWSPLSSTNSITYSNLAPGKYKFKVKAISNSGLESEIKELSFTIKPAFWQTWWFRIMVIITVLTSIYLYFLLKTKQLRKNKIELEQKIKERTEEIMEKNEELNMQNEEILSQSEEIFRKNEILLHKNNEINESINAAERIQNAFFRNDDTHNSTLPEHFVIFQPRDVVSGDFYWTYTVEFEGKQFIYFSVVDCTGHGVPGAFMSMLGLSFLKEIFNLNHLATPLLPSEILDKLRLKLVTELGQTNESMAKEGMDISLIRYCSTDGEIHFAGANNPLYYVQDSKIEVIKGDKQPISYSENMHPFSNHSLKLPKGTLLYLFSDGYADQFGGPKNKKYSYKQFRESLESISHLSLEEQQKVLLENFGKWRGYEPQIDDVCIVGIRI